MCAGIHPHTYFLCFAFSRDAQQGDKWPAAWQHVQSDVVAWLWFDDAVVVWWRGCGLIARLWFDDAVVVWWRGCGLMTWLWFDCAVVGWWRGCGLMMWLWFDCAVVVWWRRNFLCGISASFLSMAFPVDFFILAYLPCSRLPIPFLMQIYVITKQLLLIVR